MTTTWQILQQRKNIRSSMKFHEVQLALPPKSCSLLGICWGWAASFVPGSKLSTHRYQLVMVSSVSAYSIQPCSLGCATAGIPRNFKLTICIKSCITLYQDQPTLLSLFSVTGGTDQLSFEDSVHGEVLGSFLESQWSEMRNLNWFLPFRELNWPKLTLYSPKMHFGTLAFF